MLSRLQSQSPGGASALCTYWHLQARDMVREHWLAIRAVALGQGYLSVAVAGGIIERHVRSERQTAEAARLSDRERGVLAKIADGTPTRDIAADLNLSKKTIESHRRHIIEKLGLYSVPELTKYAIREGLTKL